MKAIQFHAENHLLFTGNNFSALQSYNSIIILRTAGKTFLGRDWDYSPTTGKYRNKYLNEKKSETMKKIKEGLYILADLDNPQIFKELIDGGKV